MDRSIAVMGLGIATAATLMLSGCASDGTSGAGTPSVHHRRTAAVAPAEVPSAHRPVPSRATSDRVPATHHHAAPPGAFQSVKPKPKRTRHSTIKPKPKPTPRSKPAAANCTPGYSPCIPYSSDVDCAGGSGNGPAYVEGPVRVTGDDPYELDYDHDGVGCEDD